MIAINFTTARGRLKDFCDRVTDRGETVIVTRKAEKNVVIISEERFNELEKAERNAAYLGKLERGLEQVRAGLLEMKKEHPCGARRWEVLRVGMDFRLRCTGCGREVMLPRRKAEKSLKKIISSAERAE